MESTVMMVEVTIEEWLMRRTTARVLGTSSSSCRERWKVEIHSFIQKIILNCLVAVTRPHRLVPRYQQVEHSSGSDRGHPPRAINGGLKITHRIRSQPLELHSDFLHTSLSKSKMIVPEARYRRVAQPRPYFLEAATRTDINWGTGRGGQCNRSQ